MDLQGKKTNQKDSSTKKEDNFINVLLSSLFGGNSPEAIKRKKLKQIAKMISKTKYHSFYRPASLEIVAPFGRLIFDIYKSIAQAQIYFRNTQNPEVFKRQVIHYSMSENQRNFLESFDERVILEKSKTIPIDTLNTEVEKNLQLFVNEFDSERTNRAEGIFKAFSVLKDFCSFDFYMILKKFNSSYQEFSFNSLPVIEKVNGEYILDELIEFITVSHAIIDDSLAWNDLFSMLKETLSKELINFGTWKKIIAKMKNVLSSQSLNLIIQHIMQDPKYEISFKPQYYSIVEPFIEKIENDTRNLLSMIKSSQKQSKANDFLSQIFGNSVPQSLKFYTPSFNAPLEKKNLSTLEYAEPLNYLKAFLVDYLKKNIREFYDVVVIRGQWDATLSAPFSNAYQELLKTSDEITKFDEMFSEEGGFGMKVKTLLPKTSHDAGAENIINRVVSDGNDTARGYIIQSVQDFVAIGKTLKQLIEDYSLPKPIIVQNWKELEKFFEIPLKTFSVDIYKKIFTFVQLMQMYLK